MNKKRGRDRCSPSSYKSSKTRVHAHNSHFMTVNTRARSVGRANIKNCYVLTVCAVTKCGSNILSRFHPTTLCNSDVFLQIPEIIVYTFGKARSSAFA